MRGCGFVVWNKFVSGDAELRRVSVSGRVQRQRGADWTGLDQLTNQRGPRELRSVVVHVQNLQRYLNSTPIIGYSEELLKIHKLSDRRSCYKREAKHQMSRNEGVEGFEAREMREGCLPSQPTIGGLRECRKDPQRGSGRNPGRKQGLVHFDLERTHLTMRNLLLRNFVTVSCCFITLRMHVPH